MNVEHFEIRRPTSAPALAEMRARVARAVERGASTIVLSGDGAAEGAETLASAARGAARVELIIEEGAGLPRASLPALAAAGITLLVVRVLRRDPGPQLELARAWASEGREVMVQLPLEPGAPSALQRYRFVRARLPGLRVELAPLAATDDIADDIAQTATEARRDRVEIALASDHPFPPCLAELPLKARPLLSARLRSEAGDGNRAHAACDHCALADRCTVTSAELARLTRTNPAIPRAIPDAAPYLRPGRNNPGKRLRVLGKDDVKKFFHVDYDFAAIGDAKAIEHGRPTSRIGVVYRCNQTCTFCELADMDVDLSPEMVRGALDAARARGSSRVIITGGEPTLCRELVEHVAYARSIGFSEIELQTNAVLLDRPGFAASLREAGLTSAQVSLHGPDAAISDRLTAAPGTHARTLRGIDALLDVGVRVLLNHLVFVDNVPLLLDFVDLAIARWGGNRERLVIQFHSPRNEFASRDEGLRHVPRYSDYASLLRAAIDRGRRAGLTMRDLQDPTGIPSLCVLGADPEYLGKIAAQAALPRYHKWESEWLTHPPACEGCVMRSACMGVPKHYLALHGDSELRPFTSMPGGEA